MLSSFLELITLLDHNREALHKRGFPDDVIDKYKLKSCHPLNAYALDYLKDIYGVEALLEAGLYQTDERMTGVYSPQRQLCEDNIIIPYFKSETGEVAKLRPHKLGFKGQGVSVFRTFSSFRPNETCVICESEFKAIAAEHFGYSAIGIPGISSMSGKNWEYFKEVLTNIQANTFIICFDTEVKDNEKHKNFKPDWRKRYDTIIYAYAMAQKILLDLGRTCKIATLPYEWMQDGKIDMDTALAQKRSPQEISKVIERAQPPKAYLDAAPIPQSHRSFVTRRVRRFFYEPSIELRHNCFYEKDKMNEQGAKTPGAKLTNCHLAIKNVYEEFGTESEGMLRDIVIVDEYGTESKLIPIKAGEMAAKSRFKEWLMAQGNFLFYGSDNSITNIWEWVFANDDGNVVYLVNRCGYIKEFGFHLFKNVLIKDGAAVFPDESGIFWIDEVGFKPNTLSEGSPVPSLVTDQTIDINHYTQLLSNTMDLDRPGLGKLLMAWVVSILFMPQIEEAFHLFPILFIYGEFRSGKTTLIRWLTALFGQSQAISMLGKGSSYVGITRNLDYYAYLPYVVDDWRNTAENRPYIPLFLGAYNRQGGSKGVKNRFGLQQTKVRSALVIMGQETVNDSAVMSRCISLYMPKARVKESSMELDDLAHKSSAFIYQLFTSGYTQIRASIVNKIKTYNQNLKNSVNGLDARVSINYSILGACYEAVFGADLMLDKLILDSVTEGHQELLLGDEVSKFAEEFLFGVSEGIIQSHFFIFEKDYLYLWLRGICDVLNKYYNRNNGDNSKIMMQHFSRQPYFEGIKLRAFKGDLGKIPCLRLHLTRMPEHIKQCFEGARNGYTDS